MNYSEWLELNKSERIKEFLEILEFELYCKAIYGEDCK